MKSTRRLILKLAFGGVPHRFARDKTGRPRFKALPSGDSLAQWRAYGSRTSGFAIGFTGDGPAAAIKKEGWFLAPCIYGPSDQRTLILSLVEEALEECLDRKNAKDSVMDRDDWERGGSLGAYLHRYALMLKDPSLREEWERRIISKPVMSSCDLCRSGREVCARWLLHRKPQDYQK